jgi:TolB-like protein/class 3 adenylate cyclase
MQKNKGRAAVPPGRIERRLTAILAADVASYSRLMGADEEDTLTRFKSHRHELVDPTIGDHGGRIVKSTGDGLLVEFASAVDAVRCAVEIQIRMVERNANVPPEKRIQFRIGVNAGDVMIDGDDIFGDDVNIAARLEGVAEPGGICVSGSVQEGVAGKVDYVFDDAGRHQLKNIARPVRVYRIRSGVGAAMPADLAVPVLADKPSIAILPFSNMSGDIEQEYFADGIVEEINTALSRIRWLFVIARNSTFAYKNRAVDIKRLGRELGVRYVLEGSVRKAGGRIRIAGQLIDASTGTHLWADRFDGALEDVFDLQDRVTASVVGAIAPKMERAEVERARRKPTESLNAYDYFLRGVASLYGDSRESSEDALRLFKSAMELDPGFATAFGLAARCHARRQMNGWMVDRDKEGVEAVRLARRAVFLGKDDPVALFSAGLALAIVAGDAEGGGALIDQALALDRNMAMAWHCSALVRLWLGEAATALDHEMCAMRLGPLDPMIGQMQAGAAHAHFVVGHHEEASAWAGRAVRGRPNWIPGVIVAAASTALCGRLSEARVMVSQLRKLDPTLRIAALRDRIPFRRVRCLAAYESGLRDAGLPE